MSKAKEVKYIFKVVPHAKQRYETLGDWIPGRPAQLIASKLNNADYEFLIMLHELVEHELCKKKGINDREIVAFDKKFERERMMGMHSATAEPGDNPHSPYRREHRFATRIERLVAKQMGIKWKTYERQINKIWARQESRYISYRR